MNKLSLLLLVVLPTLACGNSPTETQAASGSGAGSNQGANAGPSTSTNSNGTQPNSTATTGNGTSVPKSSEPSSADADPTPTKRTLVFDGADSSVTGGNVILNGGNATFIASNIVFNSGNAFVFGGNILINGGNLTVASPPPTPRDPNATINPSDPSVVYTGPLIRTQGRMANGSNGTLLFNWAGSSFTCRPAATSVAINISVPDGASASSQMLDVYVDGALQPQPVVLAHATTTYNLALPDTNPHTVSWVLRTEANYGTGTMVFRGITASGGSLLPTASPSGTPRQIEFIGDSVTNGYGARSQLHVPPLGRDNACTVDGNFNSMQDSSTQSASLSFASLTARHFAAQYALVASSGRGVWRNLGTTSDPSGSNSPTMPTLFSYTLHPYSSDMQGNNVVPSGNVSSWDPTSSGWAPQVVVINLGLNDFARHGTDPTDPNMELYPIDTNAFTTAYVDLLTKVHAIYPSAKILPMAGPMLSQKMKASLLPAVANAESAFDPSATFTLPILDVGSQAVQEPTDTGCEYHPTPATHAAVASALVSALKAAFPDWQ